MADTSFDVIIIGSGPGGYVAAIRAAQLGFKTAIVERDYLGGICLNWGCIPTKALLRSAEIYHYMQHAKDYGLKADNVGYDAEAVVKRSRGVSKQLNDGVGFLMKKNKIAVIWGEADDRRARQGDGEGVEERSAQGRARAPAPIRPSTSSSRPARGRACCRASSPTRNWSGPISRPWCRRQFRSRCWWSARGAIGIEFASFYRTLGAEVTVVEVLPQILPVEDQEISAFARKSFEKQGIKILTNAKVTKLDKKADSVTATIEAEAARRRPSPSSASSPPSAWSAISRISAWKSSA